MTKASRWEDGEADTTSKSAGGKREERGSKKMSTLAGVGKAFQFVSRTIITKRNRVSDVAESQNEFVRKFGLGAVAVAYAEEEATAGGCRGAISACAVNPASRSHYVWTGIMTVVILYNAITIVMRAVFHDMQQQLFSVWCVFDYFSDCLYLIDMAVKFRTGYLEHGLLVRGVKKLALNYIRSVHFKLDVLSILPTDIIYLCGYSNPLIRINRLLRLSRAFEFTDRTETSTNWPNAVRVSCLIIYILIIIHWNGCVYFAMSDAIGLGTDVYVYNDTDPYDSLSRRYITSFYWSTLSLTTIGETRPPVTDLEYMFNIADYFIGVLIFASIVGNVGSMITNMNVARSEFQNRMDAVKQYMAFQKIGEELESRVIKWFDYLWSNKQSLSDDSVLETLPDKLRAEIAIRVHFDMLRKVRLFQDCEAGLLAEMVLKLRLQVFSPGDYICRKGDIGKEMYIVKQAFMENYTNIAKYPSFTVGTTLITNFSFFTSGTYLLQSVLIIGKSLMLSPLVISDASLNLLSLATVPMPPTDKFNNPNRMFSGSGPNATCSGKLQVVGDDGLTVFATLTDGAVFGELSILNIPGNKTGNRRTANVRSVGYSDLFALSNNELWEVLKEYPEAKKILIQKGREILKKDDLLDEEAAEECETLDEKSEGLDAVIENLQTRFARLTADYGDTQRKLNVRIKVLEKKLATYKTRPLAVPQIELPKDDAALPADQVRAWDDAEPRQLFSRTRLSVSRRGSFNPSI